MHEARVRARARALPRAFLEEIARPDLDAKTTHAAIAGLIVLRMVDRWVAGGCRPVDVTGARKAVDEMEAGNPAKNALAQTLEVVGGRPASRPDEATHGLLTYANLLQRDGRWHLAIAVFSTVIAYAGVASSSEQVFAAYIRKAQAQRTTGAMDEAIATTTMASTLAASAGNPSWTVQVQLSFAVHATVQDDLDGAEAMLDEAWNQAPPDLPRYLRARILNCRGLVAGLRGQHEPAFRHWYAALDHDPEAVERDRILQNLGEAFRIVGCTAAARDTFLILSGTSEEREVRFVATLSLMLIAAEEGNQELFEQHRRQADDPGVPPSLRVDYLQHLSLAASSLGDETTAEAATREARLLAAEYAISLERFTPTRARTSHGEREAILSLPQTIADVAAAMRSLREAANVDG
jgi:hypothetical protein